MQLCDVRQDVQARMYNSTFLKMYKLLVLATLCLPLSRCYRDGARQESCYNMLVIHENGSAPVDVRVVPPVDCGSSCDYQLSVVGRVAGEDNLTVVESDPGSYLCGETYQCKLQWSDV